ncbi:MAG: hypothetical protein IJ817_03835, partial [Clostridia bacterium]|nr:hypothetical protein [Clostridia bacterium]
MNTVNGTAAAEVSRFAPKNILVTSDVYLDKKFSVNDKNIVGTNHIIKFVVKGALSDTALFDVNQNSFRDALVVGVADARYLRNTASLFMTSRKMMIGTTVKVSNVSVYGSIRNVKYTLNKTIYPVSSVNNLGTNINSSVTVNVLDATIAGEKGKTSSDVSVKISENLDGTDGTNNKNNNILISGDGMDGQNASENNEPKKGGNAGTVTIKNNGLLPKFYRSGVNGIGGYSLSGKYRKITYQVEKERSSIFHYDVIKNVTSSVSEAKTGSLNGLSGGSSTAFATGGTIRQVNAQSSAESLEIGIGSFGRIYAGNVNKYFMSTGAKGAWYQYNDNKKLLCFGPSTSSFTNLAEWTNYRSMYYVE